MMRKDSRSREVVFFCSDSNAFLICLNEGFRFSRWRRVTIDALYPIRYCLESMERNKAEVHRRNECNNKEMMADNIPIAIQEASAV